MTSPRSGLPEESAVPKRGRADERLLELYEQSAIGTVWRTPVRDMASEIRRLRSAVSEREETIGDLKADLRVAKEGLAEWPFPSGWPLPEWPT